jgi:GntR family transcriptional repressor for pyruvate dehydrogenase complex
MFEQVHREPRLPDKVASAILESILVEDLSPGDALPTERELAEQFGVSRTVIREAVRALSAKGLLEVRGGSGVRVAAVEARTVSDAMQLFVWSSTVEMAKLHEVRSMLEITAAGLAAERASAADLALLETSLGVMERALDDNEAAAQADVEFHRLIAATTHNELFVVLHDSIGGALVQVRRENLALGRERRAQALAVHRGILERIAAGDVGGAREAMRAHLDEVRVEPTRPGGPGPVPRN